MNALTIILIILAALIVLLFIAGWVLSGITMGIKRQTYEGSRAWQEERYDLSWYDLLKKETYKFSSFDGYVINVQTLINPEPSDKYVIISHGYTDNRFGALKYAKMYLDLGFNVVTYDLRGHGENEPTYCTYTIRERKDLRELIKDTIKRYPDLKALGLHGESLGAATSIAVLYYQPEIDFVVSDCAFCDLYRVLAGGMKYMHLPEALLKFEELFIKLRYHVTFDQMRPIDSLKGNKIPILFIHGEADNLIPPYNSEAMVIATEGYKDLRLIKGAPHAESVITAPGEYAEYVKEFLEVVYSNKDK